MHRFSNLIYIFLFYNYVYYAAFVYFPTFLLLFVDICLSDMYLLTPHLKSKTENAPSGAV